MITLTIPAPQTECCWFDYGFTPDDPQTYTDCPNPECSSIIYVTAEQVWDGETSVCHACEGGAIAWDWGE